MERHQLYVSLCPQFGTSLDQKPNNIVGKTRLYYFVRRRRTFLTFRQGLLMLALSASLANLISIIHLHKSVPVLESYILEPLAVLGAASLTYFNHTRNRISSSVLLVFWPIYLACLAIWARSVATRDPEYYRLLLLLKGLVASFGFASFLLECVSPEIGAPENEKSAHENPVLTANLFSRWVGIQHLSSHHVSYIFS
jgi:hypothetical protein